MGNSEILKEIETENFVWIIYLFIIGLSFLANKFEKDYYINGNIDDKEKYRIINIMSEINHMYKSVLHIQHCCRV